MRFLRSLVTASALTGLVLAATSGAASASGGPAARWRISFVSGTQLSSFAGIAAVSAHDAWAVGDVSLQTGVAHPLIRRWNGRSWLSVSLPARYKEASPTAVAASSPSDVWVFGSVPNSHGVRQSFALRWNGSWSTLRTWRISFGASSAVVLGPRDVWVFGVGSTWHYNGRTWTKFNLPYALFTASAISSNDIWAVGYHSATMLPVLARWHNGSWNVQKAPVPVRSGFPTVLTGVQAFSDRDIWLFGAEGGPSAAKSLAMERHNGKWSFHDPAGSIPLQSVVPDGSGGMWAAFGSGPYDGGTLDHYTAGRWHRVVLPAVKGKATSATFLARVPRTSTVFAAGLVLWGGLPYTEAMTLEYSR